MCDDTRAPREPGLLLKPSLSRREALKQGVAAALGGTSLVAAASSTAAQSVSRSQSQSIVGRRYRGFVRRGNRASIEELQVLPLTEHRVVVRTEATQCCYTSLPDVLGSAVAKDAFVPGHGGVGIVEAVGPGVRRVQAGERVIVTVTPWCGECFNCMNGRPDRCRGLTTPASPVAQLQDGVQLFGGTGAVGGGAELMIADEEYVVPITSKADASELSLLSCVSSCGLGMAMTRAPVEPGSDVVVLGAGPVGLSVVQGARIRGASQIIVVEPLAYRRQLALTVGATLALDPAVEGAGLVGKIRDLCRRSESRWAGGGKEGPDYVFEAVGGDLFPPREPGPDPTGVLPLQQAWELGSLVGVVVTSGVGQPADANVTFPATAWANGQTHHMAGKGTNLKRDMPRFVRFIETRQFDAKSLVTKIYSLGQTMEAYQAVADRTNVCSIISFT